jgi:uncharacterized damage-inducible protein DinB
MTAHDIICTMIDYHVSTNRHLWGVIQRNLTDAQFAQDLGYSWGSIRSVMAHMMSVDRWRVNNVLERTDPGQLNPDDYPTRDSFDALFQDVEQRLLDLVSSLSEDDLDRVPADFKESVWQLLMQVVNHGTDHRAQMLAMLHQMGIPTFPQDFIFYLWEHQTMSRDEVLAKIRAGWQEWDSLLQCVPRERLTEPFMGVWSLKDVIAHMTWGENEMLNLMRTRSMATASPLWGEAQDERNRQMVEARSDAPLDAVLQEAQQVHRDMITELEKLEDTDLNEAAGFAEMPADWHLWKLLEQNTWTHYTEHINLIRAWLEKERA